MLLPCWIRSTFDDRTRSSGALSTARLSTAGLVLALLGLGGCAQSPQQVAAVQHSKEYFPASIYGPASRRVIADGQPIPPGGGQYLVGKPYTVAGQTYYPSERKVTQVGLASWYGDAFHGRLTANGEIYDRDGFTAAHPTMPLPSYARVTNLRNNYSMIVRVNDRGPYHANRVMDVSKRVADALDFQRGGTSKVKVEYVGRASLAGSDNSRLYATLRTDGPARAQGLEEATAVAEIVAPAPAHVASLASDIAQPTYRRRPVAEEAGSAEIEPHHAPRHAPGEDVRLRHADVEAAVDRSAHRSAPLKGRDSPIKASQLSSFGQDERITGRTPLVHDVVEGRAIGSRQLAALIRSDHAVAATPRAGVSKAPTHSAAKTARESVMPPARPLRMAAAALPSTAHHHGAGGLRFTRARDD